MGRGPISQLKRRLVASYSQWAASRRLRFDPDLPALPQAFDMDSVARLFEQRWSELSPGNPGPVRVRRCVLQTVRYEPAHCVSTYDLQVQRSGSALEQTIGAVNTTSAGLWPRLYTDDPQLPWLRRAADAGEMLPRLAALPEGTPGQIVRENSSVEAVRYWPGRRCTFRYTVASRGGVQVLYGKVLRRNGEGLMAMLQSLHEQCKCRPAMPQVPRPLAYWPDLHLLAVEAVENAGALSAQLNAERTEVAACERWLREAGTSLAALHLQAQMDGPRWSFERELTALREQRDAMVVADPRLVPRFESAVDRLATASNELCEPQPTVCYGAYRPNQCLVGGRGPVLVDLDTLCLANPAKDVGSFLGHLDWWAIRRRRGPGATASMTQAFLGGYRDAGATVDTRWLALYRAATLLAQAGRLIQNLKFVARPWAPSELLDAASVMLAEMS